MAPYKLLAAATLATGLLLGTPTIASAQVQPAPSTAHTSETSSASASARQFCIQYGFMRLACWGSQDTSTD